MCRPLILALVFVGLAIPALPWTHGAIPSDPTGGVLPAFNDAFLNWKNAGLAAIGGIPNRSTQCGSTLAPSGLTPPMTGDDAANLQAAINSCTAGQVLLLGSGTFNFALSELPIFVTVGITIRGSGTCNVVSGVDGAPSNPYCPTVLQTYDGPQPTYNTTPQCGVTIGSTSACPNTAGFFFIAPQGLFNFGWAACPPSITDPTLSNCGTTIAADVAQGAKTIQVASTSNFSVGMWVLIDESPQMVTTTDPTGGSNILASPEFLNTSGAPAVMRVANPDGGNNSAACTSGGGAGYSFCTNRVNEEIHLVTAVGAGPCPGTNCTLTFDDPVTLAFRQSGSHDARAYWPTLQTSNVANPFLTMAGIENLSLTRVTGGGINFTYCAYCWVKGVEVGGWIAGAVNTEYSARVQITGNYIHDCYDCQNNGNEYPIGISTASTEVLADNNIIRLGGKGMVGRAALGSVIAYNYVDDTFYEATSIGDYWNDMSVNGSHYAGTHHFLFEGNWGNNCDNDQTHGNAIYHTYLRNQCSGIRSIFVDPSNSLTVNDAAGIAYSNPPLNTPTPPAPLRAAGPMAWDYWMAYVGNVLGLSGVTTSGNGWVYSLTQAGNQAIWLSGWSGATLPGPDPNLNGTTSNKFIFRHGNYDYVTVGIAEWATGFSHTLPNSFYLSARPSYFGPSGTNCTYPWPGVTPTSGSVLQTPTGAGCAATDWLPAKARWAAGTPFVQP